MKAQTGSTMTMTQPPPTAGEPQGQPPVYHYHYAPPPKPPYNGLAIASLVLGILWLWWIGSLLALVFAYTARQQIRENNQSGDGLAVAGLVLGWIGAATFGLTVVGFIASALGAS